jgi:hypothetical protein
MATTLKDEEVDEPAGMKRMKRGTSPLLPTCITITCGHRRG